MKIKKLQFKSIALRLVFAICSVVTLSLIAVGTYSYLSIAKKVEVMLGERLEHMVRTGTLLVNAADHEAIENAFLEQEENIPNKEEFKRVKANLDQIKKINDLSVEVYTVIGPEWAEGNMIFIAMSGNKNFTGNSMLLNKAVKKVIDSGLPQHTDLYEDHEGIWVSAMAPIKNKDGKVIAVMEVDYEAKAEVYAAKKEVLIAIGFPALIAFICAVGLGIYLGKSLAKPVISLSSAAQQVAAGDLNVKVEIITADEIGSLSAIFNSMTSELKTSREQLEDYAKNLEEKVRQRTAEVVASKKKIQNILDNIEQGVVTFSDNFTLDDEFSAFVTRFYNIPKEEVAGRPYYDFLFPKAKITSNNSNLMVESIKAIIGEDELAWSLNNDHLPHELVIEISGNEKIIGVDWTPMLNAEGIIDRLMVVIKDLTQQRSLELQLEKERREGQQMVSGIIEMMKHPKQKIISFLNDTQKRIIAADANINYTMNINQLFIDLHTIKGAARVLSLNSLTNSTHEAEEPVQKLRTDPSNEEYPTIIKQKFKILQGDFNRFHETFNKIYGSENQEVEKISFLTLLSQQMDGIKKRLNESRMQFTCIDFEDSVVEWQEEHLQKLSSVFIHALNNSVDHGYILPVSRGQTIKDLEIRVSAKKIDNKMVILSIEDSGGGLNVEQIKEKAIEKGLYKEGMNSEEIIDLLFMDGFSTAEITTETSGRGVGLSAIRKFIKDLGGETVIQNRLDKKGSKLSVTLPMRIE
jgi:signal transduction histidine kinase